MRAIHMVHYAPASTKDHFRLSQWCRVGPATGFMSAGFWTESLSQIFRRIANSIKPFNLMLVHRDLPPPLLECIYDDLGKQERLFDQLHDGQANKL